MGQNNSITYEITVQMGVTVVKGRLMQTAAEAVFLRNGFVLKTDKHAPESYHSLFPPVAFNFSSLPSLYAFPFSY